MHQVRRCGRAWGLIYDLEKVGSTYFAIDKYKDNYGAKFNTYAFFTSFLASFKILFVPKDLDKFLTVDEGIENRIKNYINSDRFGFVYTDLSRLVFPYNGFPCVLIGNAGWWDAVFSLEGADSVHCLGTVDAIRNNRWIASVIFGNYT